MEKLDGISKQKQIPNWSTLENIPVFKKRAPFLPLLSELFEMLFSKQLAEFFERILSKCQCGFVFG